LDLLSCQIGIDMKDGRMKETEIGTKEGPIMPVTTKVENAAQAYLELLASRGIEYFFANPGTDFASIIDGFARREAEGKAFPRPMAVPHETPLVSMAHGYYLITGKPQAAMVHVGIGTANGLGALMTAHRARVPILFSAGRTPITEEGNPASRGVYIHWGQEAYDQAGIVREYVKWDYELRDPSHLEDVVDRAIALAMTEPRGPVYLTLPREVLATPLEEMTFKGRARYDLPTFHPDPEKIEEAADLLTRARFPLIITSSAGRSPAAVQALKELAESGAIGVVSFFPEYMNFATSHPCHQGFSPDPHFPEADVILVIDSDVPWFPNTAKPGGSTRVISAGIDPFYSDYPMRSFPSDLTLQGEPGLVLAGIGRAMARHPDRDEERLQIRMKILREKHDELVKGWQESAKRTAHDRPIDPQWVSYNVNRVLRDDTVVVNEYDNSMREHAGQRPGSFFSSPHGGFLGWGVGAALGIRLASPEGVVIATVGDGSYIFSVPSACHLLSATQNLPILVIVYNNQCWSAVKGATLALHPEGWAARTNNFPMSQLGEARYEKICEAFGGYAERVEGPEQMGPALERALYAVREEKRQALLNVVCKHP
jgi:acetolactate synthase-1/2/3 large subunit